MIKKISYGKSSRERMVSGVDQVANAVKVTLGPKGKTVVIESGQYGGAATVTKDGVSVAKAIHLEDRFENMGAQLTKEVASRTADVSGDGTTTATVLAQAIVKLGMNAISNGAKPTELKKGLEFCSKAVIADLDMNALPVLKISDVANVGMISANNDAEIGEILAKAMDSVGIDGVVSVGRSGDDETVLEVQEGIQFSRGYIHNAFATDEATGSVEYNNPLVLVTDLEVSAYAEILPLLDAAANLKRPLLIICDDLKGEALGGVVGNKQQGLLQVVAVKAPEFGEQRADALLDLAYITGAQFISSDNVNSLADVRGDALGSAERISVGKKTTTIFGGKGEAASLETHIENVRTRVGLAESDYKKEIAQKRLAALTGGIAVVRIGAKTEAELLEKVDRVEDALHATRAAVEEGIVPGGGLALANTSRAVSASTCADGWSDGFTKGYDILLDAIRVPLETIIGNADVSFDVVDNTLSAFYGTGNTYGYNASTEEYGSLIEMGVIDPVKVTKNAVANAVSIASLVLTTECVITYAAPKS